MQEFSLDPRLAVASVGVTDLALCEVRLMRDANYPWLMLVPRRAALLEIVDLDAGERSLLMDEIARVSEALRAAVPCDKLNVAALGNIVPQLHVHVIARRRGDPAWPKPVWGAVPPTAYDEGASEALAAEIATRLK